MMGVFYVMGGPGQSQGTMKNGPETGKNFIPCVLVALIEKADFRNVIKQVFLLKKNHTVACLVAMW